MKFKKLLLIALLAPQCLLANAASVTGKLVDGGGVDDMFVVVRAANGHEVHAYCLRKCGSWFRAPDKDGVVALKPQFKGKKVVLQYVTRMNSDDAIAGEGNAPIEFVVKMDFVK